MKPMQIQEIAAAIGSDFKGDDVVTSVSTDTRTIQPGSLFIAVRGENFNGHDFIHKAFEQGAAYAIASEPGDYPTDRVLRVENSRAALLCTANLYRSALDLKVVGITGSVGKTTTKEMTACALSSKYLTLKNEANLNNEIGLSHTIFQLNESHQAAVLEMGMDGPGQIRPLSLCARPDVAIVTNIGVSHLEAMDSREQIRREKLSIADGMPDGSTLILCADDEMLQSASSDRLNILFFGINNRKCDILGARVNEFSTHTTFEILYDGNRLDASIPCIGRHNVYNALAAFTAAVTLGCEPQEAVAALKNYKPAGMRQNIVQHNSFTVVEDCYNASPDSMHAALNTLSTISCHGRRIAVLSDMLELGFYAPKAHYETGALAASLNIDMLLCIGEHSKGIVRGAKDSGMESVWFFETKEKLFNFLKAELKPGDTAWFKASRGMRLEEVISRIYKEC